MTERPGAAGAATEAGAGAPAHAAGASAGGAGPEGPDGVAGDSAAGAPAGVPPALAPCERVVLLGIGNELRGDDGAGPRVARALGGRVPWDLRAVHGLTPELADDLADCDLALFVDAHADPALERPAWRLHERPREPLRGPAADAAASQAPAPPAPALLGHALDVPRLLALTRLLHGRAREPPRSRCPRATSGSARRSRRPQRPACARPPWPCWRWAKREARRPGPRRPGLDAAEAGPGGSIHGRESGAAGERMR
jgi:hypothetical protein